MENIMKSENRFRNWGDLHVDLLISVVKKIEVVEDLFSFRGVCTGWHSVVKDNFGRVTHQPPLLMFAIKDNNNNRKLEFREIQEHKLVDPLSSVVYYTSKIISLYEGNPYYLGWRGWLLVRKRRGICYLVHVLSRTQKKIMVPSIDDFIPVKVVLPSCPLTSPLDTIVMAVLGVDTLAFWRPGEQCFTKTNDCKKGEKMYDMIFYDGFFYGITKCCSVRVFDVTGTPPEIVEEKRVEPFPLHCDIDFHFQYLVELGEELAIVVRTVNEKVEDKKMCLAISKFRVFTIDRIDCKWSEMKDIGNRAIFVGMSASFSVNGSVKKSQVAILI